MEQGMPAGVVERVREMVLSESQVDPVPGGFPDKPLWAEMQRWGSDLWLDTGDIGEISALWCRQFTSLTTNNTLLNREVQKGTYDNLIGKVAGELRGKVPPDDLTLEIAFVLNACHGRKLSGLFGAKVSVEMHTALAHDVERTVAYGLRYHAIAPESFYVKVPLTPAGLIAARRLGEAGVPVNFTLGFSARQNWLTAALARPALVNVFLGRLNAFVADQKLGTGNSVGEKATLASQRIIRELRSSHGLGTRQIAASIRDGAQVAALAGVDVLTMPSKVARQFEEIHPAAGTLSSQVDSDPEVELAPSVSRKALGLDVLWEVPEKFRKDVADLLKRDLSNWSAGALCGFLTKRGFADLVPDWSPTDIGAITSDGKIPQYSRWKDRLARREVGLDALMTVSGLCSFATDQKAMDDRIRSKL